MTRSGRMTHPNGRRGARSVDVDLAISVIYAGLACFLVMDVALRNSDADLPLAGVLALWLAAFSAPVAAVVAARWRRR